MSENALFYFLVNVYLALLSLLVLFILLCYFRPPMQTHMQSQRALLLQGTESLNNASQSIERSQRIAAETEQIGTDIISELGEQREQLDRTRNRVSCELELSCYDCVR